MKLLVLAALSSTLAMGTNVIAEWSPTLVTIGVDGKGTYHANGKDTAVASCKALRNGNTLYVAAGDIPPSLKASVLSIRDESEAVVHASNDAIAGSLQSLTIRKTHYPPYRPGAEVLALYAARFDLKKVTFRITRFVIGQYGIVRAEPHDLPGSSLLCACPKDHPVPLPRDWANLDPVKMIRDAFATLFQYPDATSGPPLTIVKVTPAGVEWLEPGNCLADGGNAWDTTPPQ
jgi:hypothetical protein